MLNLILEIYTWCLHVDDSSFLSVHASMQPIWCFQRPGNIKRREKKMNWWIKSFSLFAPQKAISQTYFIQHIRMHNNVKALEPKLINKFNELECRTLQKEQQKHKNVAKNERIDQAQFWYWEIVYRSRKFTFWYSYFLFSFSFDMHANRISMV